MGTLVGVTKSSETSNDMSGWLLRLLQKEVNGVSIGYRVKDWAISDGDGNIIDLAIDSTRWDESDLTFTASKWELLEISLCGVPADTAAGVRAYGDRAYPPPPKFISDARARMAARQRMYDCEQAMRRRLYA